MDAGYVDAALLVAKRQSEAEQAYEQRHFAIDWERQQITFPQGKRR